MAPKPKKRATRKDTKRATPKPNKSTAKQCGPKLKGFAKRGIALVSAPPAPRESDTFLNILKVFFETASTTETLRVWHILSALRGPDDGVLSKKRATTAVIRNAALGAGSLFRCIDILPDTPVFLAARKELSEDPESQTSGYHFVEHVKDAFAALNLDWDSVND